MKGGVSVRRHLRSPLRRLPVGAEVLPDGGVHFRVWSPRCKAVSVVLEGGPGTPPVAGAEGGASPAGGQAETSLKPEPGGYFSGRAAGAGDGTLYRFRLDGENDLQPDPASRYQPEGPEGPSQVIDPALFRWSDQAWPGVRLPGQVVYEMHIGTFTPEGTFEAAARLLPELVRTGVTLLQVMPVAEFAGPFGWGYDGVDLFAPSHLYGAPDDFRRFVDRAHALGLGVILDVVYNHLGPVGNCLPRYSPDYFSDRYRNEWGEAINFDGPNSGPVREFFASNAGYWVDEFHLDGFRLDATQQICDASPEHILAVLAREARRRAERRSIVILAENEPQQVRLVQPPERGGCGLDGLLSDDFHHAATVALTGRHEAYCSDFRGTPQELISCARWGTLYQGQYFPWQKRRRGTPAFGLPAHTFVHYLQNHDQVANSARGVRIHQLASPGRYRALTALLLLGPQTPLLFQGQEFGASSPFLYFAGHRGELARKVREGRAEFLSQFPALAGPEARALLPDPADPQTFQRSKLDPAERERRAGYLALHRDLLRLRREDPVFRAQEAGRVHGAVIGPEALCLRFFGGRQGDRLLLVNLGPDLSLAPAPEPLLAPPAEADWRLLWSSESARYGGCGTAPQRFEQAWTLPGHSALVLSSRPAAGEDGPATGGEPAAGGPPAEAPGARDGGKGAPWAR